MKHIKTYQLFEEEKSTRVSVPPKDEIIKMLRRNFYNYTKPGSTFPVEVKNNKGETIKTIEFHFDRDGELHMKENLSEGNFTKGLAALCLVGGMLTSCKKYDGPKVGYNISVTPTVYKPGGSPNKSIKVFTPSGYKTIQVDSTTAQIQTTDGTNTGFYTGSTSGMKIKRKMTPTEAYIIKAGAEAENERRFNNGKGTSNISDIRPENVTITSYPGLYQDPGEPKYEDCREHPYWNSGLEALLARGENTDDLIRKADREVNNQDWWKDDLTSRNEKLDSGMVVTKDNIDESLFYQTTPSQGFIKYFKGPFSTELNFPFDLGSKIKIWRTPDLKIIFDRIKPDPEEYALQLEYKGDQIWEDQNNSKYKITLGRSGSFLKITLETKDKKGNNVRLIIE